MSWLSKLFCHEKTVSEELSEMILAIQHGYKPTKKEYKRLEYLAVLEKVLLTNK